MKLGKLVLAAVSAVALAAGRGQLVQWLDQPLHGGLGGVMSDADLQRLVGSIADGLNRENIAWRQLGDIIDAVTLCLNAPTKYANPNPQTPGPLALTDRVGRHEDSARWAWCGQLFGDEGESVWRAMCALFLQPTKAWFFDGYQGKAQFAEYEIEPAVEQFTLRGFEVDVASMTGGDANAWRAHARLGIDAGFIHVNTSGVSRRFNLASGRPYGSDIPMLWTPAITQIQGEGRDTIIGIIDGRFFGIEVKIGKDRQSADQKEIEKEINAAGGVYFIAKSYDDYLSKINEY